MTLRVLSDGNAASTSCVVELTPPAGGPLARLAVAAVVDTSGSMQDSCNPGGGEQARFYSKARSRGAFTGRRVLGRA